jgi:hypothetical protein
MAITYTKQQQNVPNVREIYQKFQFQGFLKYTQIGIFGMQMNHLATLVSQPHL